MILSFLIYELNVRVEEEFISQSLAFFNLYTDKIDCDELHAESSTNKEMIEPVDGVWKSVVIAAGVL